MVWLAGFVLLSVVGLLLASYSRDEDACLLACGLALLSGAAIPAWYGDVLYLLAPIDAFIGCFALVMWLVRPLWWLRAFLTMTAMRLGAHISIALVPAAAQTAFFHLLNAAFVAQVALVSQSGGIRLGTGYFNRVRCRLRVLRMGSAAVTREA